MNPIQAEKQNDDKQYSCPPRFDEKIGGRERGRRRARNFGTDRSFRRRDRCRHYRQRRRTFVSNFDGVRNKMDLSLGIALGSSLQIALFVAPLLVFASYLFGSPMNLEFTIPEVVAVLASVFIVQQISSDGESNWIEGVQLLSVYAILGILFYFLPEAH